jgi:hypothetical protein
MHYKEEQNGREAASFVRSADRRPWTGRSASRPTCTCAGARADTAAGQRIHTTEAQPGPEPHRRCAAR